MKETHLEDGAQFRHINTLSVQQLPQDVAFLGPHSLKVPGPFR